MKSTWILGLGVGLLPCWPALADTITLTNGGRIEGVMNKLEGGNVYIDVSGAGVREVALHEIASVSFDTPHLTGGPPKDFDAQAMLRRTRDAQKAGHAARAELDRIKANFPAKQSKDRQSGDKDRWNAAKETFRVPLARYREALSGMYQQMLAQIEDYNKLAKEADQFRGLIPGDVWERTVKESVPENWYDRIFFDGYNRGYKEGTEFERLSRVPQACENPR